MARSTLNRNLETLEAEGLIKRVQRMHPQTKRQLNTFYVLGIDFAAPPYVEHAVSDYGTWIEQRGTTVEQEVDGEAESENGTREKPCETGSRVPQSDTGAVSQKMRKPCPKKRQSRVPKSDTNLGIEPGIEPCAAAQPNLPDGFLDEFQATHPRPSPDAETETALLAAVSDGAHPQTLLDAAVAYRDEQAGNQPQFVKLGANWLREARWECHQTRTKPPKAQPTEAEQLERWAASIAGGKAWRCRDIPPAAAQALIQAGKVTESQCRAAQVVF